MKSANNRLWICLLATAVIGLTVATAPLHAQTVPLRVEIPFAFHAGDSTLPAGTYVVTRQGDAIRVTDGNGHSAVIIASAIANASKGAANEIAFNNYGGSYFLTEVRWNGYRDARGLVKSKTELELAKAAQHETVKLAAVTR